MQHGADTVHMTLPSPQTPPESEPHPVLDQSAWLDEARSRHSERRKLNSTRPGFAPPMSDMLIEEARNARMVLATLADPATAPEELCSHEVSNIIEYVARDSRQAGQAILKAAKRRVEQAFMDGRLDLINTDDPCGHLTEITTEFDRLRDLLVDVAEQVDRLASTVRTAYGFRLTCRHIPGVGNQRP